MKHVLIIVFLVCLSSMLQAQSFEAYAIGGVTFSQIDGDNLKGYDNFGFIGGAATNFILKNDFSFQQEIVYAQRGSSNKDGSFKKDLHYVDVLLLLNKVYKEKWAVQVGLGAGKLLKIKTDDTGDKLSFYRIETFAALGGGYFVTDNLLFNARIQYSVLPALKSNAPFYNNAIAFSLRWRFVAKD